MDLKSDLRKELSRTRMNLVALNRGIDRISDLAGSVPAIPKVEDWAMIQLVSNIFKLTDESSVEKFRLQIYNEIKALKGCPQNHDWDIPLTKKILNKVAALLEEPGMISTVVSEVQKKRVVPIVDEAPNPARGQSGPALVQKRKIDTMHMAGPSKSQTTEAKTHFARGGVDQEHMAVPAKSQRTHESRNRFARGVDEAVPAKSQRTEGQNRLTRGGDDHEDPKSVPRRR